MAGTAAAGEVSSVNRLRLAKKITDKQNIMYSCGRIDPAVLWALR